MGWEAGAAWLFGQATREALEATAYRAALTYGEHQLACEGRRGSETGVARALFDLGEVFNGIGDRQKALELHLEALALREREPPGPGLVKSLCRVGVVRIALVEDDHKGEQALDNALGHAASLGDGSSVAIACIARAALHRVDEEPGKALALYQKAQSAAAEAHDGRRVADALLGMGELHTAAGRPDDAEDCWAQALRIHQADIRPRGVVEVLMRMASSSLRAGDPTSALALQKRVRALAEEFGLAEAGLQSLWGTAEAALAGGEAAASAKATREAARALAELTRGLSDEQGARAREKRAALFHLGERAGLALGDLEELAYFLEASRAGMLLEYLTACQAGIEGAYPPDLLASEKEARADEARCLWSYNKVMATGRLRVIRAHRKKLNAARERAKGTVERIQRILLEQAGVKAPEFAPLSRIQGWLEPTDALVLYAMLDDEALALVVRHQGARVVALGDAPSLRELCENMSDIVGMEDADAFLARLRGRLTVPLALPDDVTRVLVGPEGPLFAVPFGPLFPGRDVAHVPSATTYGRLRKEQARIGEGVLAVGDPCYATSAGTPLAASAARGVTLIRLPATSDEARAVGDVVLLRSEASEEGLRFAARQRSRWRAVHIACHGIYDAEYPMLSALALTPTARHDGSLTALDVFRLRVTSDLLVLSACDSGLGSPVDGEGLLGLTRAFLYSGAPRVIASLGEVDDEASSALMQKFHERWKAGVPTARALREAQAYVRAQEEWRHPSFWAPWVLWGLPN